MNTDDPYFEPDEYEEFDRWLKRQERNEDRWRAFGRFGLIAFMAVLAIAIST